MTPEATTRGKIDPKLALAGWRVQDLKQFKLGAAPGIAVREYPTGTGPADYMLFVNRIAVGVIKAKRDEAGQNLTAHEAQTERYASATLRWRKAPERLRPRQVVAGQLMGEMNEALVAFRDVAAGLPVGVTLRY